MSASNTQSVGLAGLDLHTNSVVVGALTPGVSNVATECAIYAGTGAPSFTAVQGSLYLRTDGSSSTTRLYVNTTGSTAWTNITTAT
jgi:hypothetical protein